METALRANVEVPMAVITNSRLYLAIAEDAAAEATRLLEAAMKPRGDGGFVLTLDPDSKSFKQSFIAIAFAGMYLEALLTLVGTRRLGKELFKKIDRAHTTYEEKLKLLGVLNPQLLDDCKRFREARNDLMHEKPIDLDSPIVDPAELRSAQDEAEFAIATVRAIAKVLEQEA